MEFVRSRPAVAGLICVILVSLPFVLVPQIDLAVSHLFYLPDGFIAGREIFTLGLRQLGRAVTLLAAIYVLVSVLSKLFVERVRYLLPARPALFLLSALVVGQVLIVNIILKDQWQRTRPRSISDFGGQFDFTRAWEFAGDCVGNCSFVSGESAGTMWLVAFVVAVPLAWRTRYVAAALLFTFIISLNRIASGAHFLSDVMIGWALTLAITLTFYQLFYENPGLNDEKVEAAFARIRTFLRAPVRMLFGRTG